MSNIVMSPQPKNRYEFERRSYLLAELLINQKIIFHSGIVDTIYSIKNIKFLPNSRIDFLTINETVRTLLLTIERMSENAEE